MEERERENVMDDRTDRHMGASASQQRNELAPLTQILSGSSPVDVIDGIESSSSSKTFAGSFFVFTSAFPCQSKNPADD